MADVNDDAPATKRDLRELEARQDAKIDNLEAKLDAKLDAKLGTFKGEMVEWFSREMSSMKSELMREIARAANATHDEMRRWFSLLLEKHDSDIAAVNTNATQLRTEFEAHRDDAAIHRQPRRRARDRR